MKKEDVRMEDINEMASYLIDTINLTVECDGESLDHLFDEIRNTLEKFFNYPDYKNYN